MFLTVSGIRERSVNEVQPENELLPIDSRLAGKVSDSREMQFSNYESETLKNVFGNSAYTRFA